MKNNAIILAAGKGTRMNSKLYKVLHHVHGKPMIDYVIEHLNEANIERNIMVVGHGAEEVKQVVKGTVEYVIQSEQMGTGHAVMMAEGLLGKEEGTTIVICGDTPLITSNTINQLIHFHNKSKSAGTVLTTILSDATGYGRIIRDDAGKVIKIVEEKDANDQERLVNEVNTGTYCFDNQLLFSALKDITNKNAQKEYYLTDVIEVLKNKSLNVAAFIATNPDETLGINDRVSLAMANQILKTQINEKWMRAGVTIVDPQNTYISSDTKIGKDTIILPGTLLYGHNRIGEDCMIGPNTEFTNVKVGNFVQVKHSVINDSTIGDNTTVGPFAHLRNHANVGNFVRIGNFVEIKNATFGNNSNAAHLSYIGDAEVGNKVNIGCGSITVNYDGVHKHKTIIADNTFIGCNSNLIAPIKIGENVYVAAGSTLTKDVPDGALAIARSTQTNKELYAQKYKKQ